ncbi:50S ribosomal protein L32e [Intoshia linei]|uniref:60S ribosomal protein L32 n=1 Tax=Intoshia linei TaxID=1819745 RepID=A0A177B7I1_9BILA|nr:50S ribosomal protein L32e [Intoshia linei]
MVFRIKPTGKTTKIKKHIHTFKRYQCTNFKRVRPSWRKPHGIDSKLRKRFKGTPKQPKIGYGTDKRHRHICPDGFKHFLIHNVKELEPLMMNSKTYAAVIASNVSSLKRKSIVTRAQELGVRVVNKNARLRATDA